MLFLCCFDARNDEFDRQRGEIAWSLNNCLIISGTCNIIYGMIYFKFILVPVFIAYFLTFLMAPVMMLLEGAIYTDFHCSRLFCDYLSARLWVYLDGPIWMGLFGWAARPCVINNQVSFRWKNPDFTFKNLDLLIKNLHFLIKNLHFITKTQRFCRTSTTKVCTYSDEFCIKDDAFLYLK